MNPRNSEKNMIKFGFIYDYDNDKEYEYIAEEAFQGSVA